MKNLKLNLLYKLITHQFRNKYKGTFLGLFWTLLEPLVIISILLFVFIKLFRPNVENYPSFLIIGFITWNFFIKGTATLDSIVINSPIIKSSLIPKEFIVISSCSVVFISSIFEFMILMIVLSFLGITIGFHILFLPLIILLQFFFILGIAFVFNAIYVNFRDLDHVWKVISEALFFSTPIIYPNSLLIKDFPLLLALNPIAHFITNIRKLILYGITPSFNSLLILGFISITSIIVGLWIFNMKKDYFIEEI